MRSQAARRLPAVDRSGSGRRVGGHRPTMPMGQSRSRETRPRPHQLAHRRWGRRALDVGASTGFHPGPARPWCAARRCPRRRSRSTPPIGAADPACLRRGGVSVRDLDSLSLDPFDILVADLSSSPDGRDARHVARAVTPEGEVVLLVKPQFEVGRERLGKNGIVSRSRDRALAIRAGGGLRGRARRPGRAGPAAAVRSRARTATRSSCSGFARQTGRTWIRPCSPTYDRGGVSAPR